MYCVRLYGVFFQYFPGRDHVVEYLNDIDTWLATQRGAITAEQWNTMLDTLKVSPGWSGGGGGGGVVLT